jgi:hypothetical protein
MTTTDKDFKVKNGLNVAGSATFQSDVILGTTPISFDAQSGRLNIQIDGNWVPVAFTADIPDTSNELTFMDVGLAIDYNGQPIYTVQGNGVVTTATKYVNGGTPSTTTFGITFDSSTI